MKSAVFPAITSIFTRFPLQTWYFLSLCALFYIVGLSENISIYFAEGKFSDLEWKLTQYFVSYVDFGFVRRGLLGTLLLPISRWIDEPSTALFVGLMVLDFVIFMAYLMILKKIIEQSNLAQSAKRFLFIVLCISPFGAMQWGFDAIRLDHINFLLLLFMFLALQKNKIVMATIILSASILIHEAAILYGFVLFCWLLLRCITSSSEIYPRLLSSKAFMPNPRVLIALVPVTTICIAIFFYGNYDGDFASQLPENFVFGAGAWERGVFEINTKMNVVALFTGFAYLFAVYYLLTRYYLANGWKIDEYYLCTFVPLLLFILGIDYARWIFFCAFSALLCLLLKSAQQPAKQVSPKISVWMLIFFVLPLGPIGIITILHYSVITALVKPYLV